MEDKDLLNKLKKSFNAVTPEKDYDDLVRRIEKDRLLEEDKKEKRKFKKWFLPFSGGLALCALALAIFILPNRNKQILVDPMINVAGIVTIDINPGFQMQVDDSYIVIDVLEVNDDARNLVDKDSLISKDVTTVVSEITDLAISNGYITKDKNQDILVTVSNSLDNSGIKENLANSVVDKLKESDVTARVNTMVFEVSEGLIAEASELGVTVGKLELMGNDSSKIESSITDIIKDNTKDVVSMFSTVSYNASNDVNSELNRYKQMLEEELNLDNQKDRLEDAYDKGLILKAEYEKSLKEIKLSLKELKENLDSLEDYLEDNGFDEDDTLDYLEDQVKKVVSSNSHELDEYEKELNYKLADVESNLARIKSEYKRGLITKAEYKKEEESLEALEDYLEDSLENYKKYYVNDKSKYEANKTLIDQNYDLEQAYLDGKISKSEYEVKEKEIKDQLREDKYSNIKEDLNLTKFSNLEKDLKELYEKGLISKKEFEKKLDNIEDYFDELEDVFEDGIDEEELDEFLDKYYSEDVKKVINQFKKLNQDFKDGLISTSEYLKEKLKFDNFKDNLEDNDDDDDFSDILEDLLEDKEEQDEEYKDEIEDDDDDDEDLDEDDFEEEEDLDEEDDFEEEDDDEEEDEEEDDD